MNLSELKKELPYKWRVQSINDSKAVCVAYIDSRDVQDLLDVVVGPDKWQSDYKEVKGNVYAGISIKLDNEWIWKWDCGVESKTEAEKGEASDSFKRAAVKWGVGRFLYSLDIVRLNVAKYNAKNYPADNSGKPIFDGEKLTDFINSLKGKKPEPPKKEKAPAKEWLDEDHHKWNDVIAAVKGKYTIEQVKKKYNVSQRIETLLTETKNKK